MFLEGNLLNKGKPALDLDIADRGSTTPAKKVVEKKAPTSQELTLSYLCENPHKAGGAEKEEQLLSGRNLLGAIGCSSHGGKDKEAASEKPMNEERRWLERDFFQLSGGGGGGGGGGGSFSKREAGVGADGGEDGGKKPKVETLNLSLALPSLGLSLGSSNPLPASAPAEGPALAVAAVPPATQEALFVVRQKRTQSINTLNTRASSDDCAASRSFSYYSNPFSHNPSCSLTRNSTENLEFSRETDQIWCAGEGTNGSVHSRFKPIGLEANAGNINFAVHPGLHRPLNNGKEANLNHSSALRANSSDNSSFFPSELPARPRETDRASSDGWKNAGLPSPDRILKGIVLESVPTVAQRFQEIPGDYVEASRAYLKNMLSSPEKKEELASLRRKLERRSDLSPETLIKANRFQLEVLAAVKTGQAIFLSEKGRLPTSELVEIFLQSRCKNIECLSVLPVDDCDCKFCSGKKGFCSACTCTVCSTFDCALNTCNWVGCDVCGHWCHAVCGIRKNLIRPGSVAGGDPGKTEMQFYCAGCGHASEMFGFVKAVFFSCAKEWDMETLSRELDCVRKIFRGSEDARGKELNAKAEEMLRLLEKKLISTADACSTTLQFLNCGPSELSTTARVSSKDKGIAQWIQREEVNAIPVAHALGQLPPAAATVKPGGAAAVGLVKKRESEPSNKEGLDSLESIVRFKEAEAELFERLAEEARREVEGYLRIARAKSQKLEEEYAAKVGKLCVQEAEERRRRKLEELKRLENSHYDYHNMKMRMQAEIAGLLERMEATKQQLV